MPSHSTTGKGRSAPSPRLVGRDLRVSADRLPAACAATRAARGLSYRAAAAAIGMTTADLHRFEHQQGDPKLSTLLRIARWIEGG